MTNLTIISAIIGWLTSRNIYLIGAIVALVAFGIYDKSRVDHGRALQREQTERTNEKAVKTVERVRSKSRSKRARGVRDPYTLD